MRFLSIHSPPFVTAYCRVFCSVFVNECCVAVNPYLPPPEEMIDFLLGGGKVFQKNCLCQKLKLAPAKVSDECMSDTAWAHTTQFVSIHRLKNIYDRNYISKLREKFFWWTRFLAFSSGRMGGVRFFWIFSGEYGGGITQGFTAV